MLLVKMIANCIIVVWCYCRLGLVVVDRNYSYKPSNTYMYVCTLSITYKIRRRAAHLHCTKQTKIYILTIYRRGPLIYL